MADKYFGPKYFKRPVGLLMIFNTLLSFICFVLNLYWMVDTASKYKRWEHSLAMWISTYSTICLVILLFLTLCDSDRLRCGSSSKWGHFSYGCHLILMWVFYLVSSSALAYRGDKWNDSSCDLKNCKIMLGSAAVGIIATIGTFVQCILTFIDWKTS